MDELVRRQLERELAVVRRETDEAIQQAVSAFAAVLRAEVRRELEDRDRRIDTVHRAALRALTRYTKERGKS